MKQVELKIDRKNIENYIPKDMKGVYGMFECYTPELYINNNVYKVPYLSDLYVSEFMFIDDNDILPKLPEDFEFNEKNCDIYFDIINRDGQQGWAITKVILKENI